MSHRFLIQLLADIIVYIYTHHITAVWTIMHFDFVQNLYFVKYICVSFNHFFFTVTFKI